MPSTTNRKRLRERLQHALWAGLIGLVLSAVTVFDPIDQIVWTAQARSASFQASGDIVYVGSNEDLTDADFPQRRKELAETLDSLREAGASRVYVDVVFDRPSDPEADRQLNQALLSFDGRAFLSRNYTSNLSRENQFVRANEAVSKGVEEVGTDRWRNYLGYTWSMPYVVTHGGEYLPSLPASIAGIERNAGEAFPINYGFRLNSIPAYRFEQLRTSQDSSNSSQALLSQFAGKIVVIGNADRADPDAPNIPGHIGVPVSMADIYAAETLIAGHTQIIGNLPVLFAALLLLCLIGLLVWPALRYTGYAFVCLSVPVAVYVTAQFGVKIYVSGALALVVFYTLFRARAKWKQNFRLVDPDTGMPTFAAMEADKDTAETVPAIIVAKIHRFEEVRKTLPAELHAEYMMRIIGRLKAAKEDAPIYIGPGHLIAWTLPEKEPALIREHLEGLRALFSSPLQVGETQVDVGITFGVDLTPSPNVTRRIATAVSAAERTTETYEPIEIAELASDEDLFWNISLQARIDAALSNGEIYLAYQPKVFVPTGELIGVEALVRWRDPVKGLIPPDHFIRQCENAGRMNHLTQHVLREACETGNAFDDAGLKLPIAVNISATLVHERGIVTMVRDVLEATGFDPHRLTLEITETYRISNFEQASEVLRELASLGAKLSMDDFGVGAASLEALLRLPFSELKIDRLFTQFIKDDEKAAGIVRNILNLGKDLRIIVVAEGIEDEATLTQLRDLGCVVAQGFGICRPVSFDEILKFQGVRASERLKNMV